LTNLLRQQTNGPANSQILYQAIYGMWLLSYNKTIIEQFHSTSAITRIVDTIRQVTKVKVIRVGIATLTVCVLHQPSSHRKQCLVVFADLALLASLPEPFGQGSQ
jgi:hypothetical protein